MHIYDGVDVSKVFEACQFCGCPDFFTQKDFNITHGALLLLLGIIFIPVTDMLSLWVSALIILYMINQAPKVVVCYRCGAEFRGFTYPEYLRPFSPQIGNKYPRWTVNK